MELVANAPDEVIDFVNGIVYVCNRKRSEFAIQYVAVKHWALVTLEFARIMRCLGCITFKFWILRHRAAPQRDSAVMLLVESVKVVECINAVTGIGPINRTYTCSHYLIRYTYCLQNP